MGYERLRLAIGIAAMTAVFPANAAELRVPEGYPTIQEAVAAAADGDTVIVAPGTYNESIDLMGKSVTLLGERGAPDTVLDGGGLESAILTATSTESTETVVRGFTFRNGNGKVAAACTLAGRLGGAVFIQDSGLTIEDSIFVSNGSGQGKFPVTGGGAIFSCNADLTLRRTEFRDNHADYGGAVRFATLTPFVVTEPVHAIVDTSMFTENSSSHGGAIQIDIARLSTVEISNSDFRRNAAAHGGAVRARNLGGAITRIVNTTAVSNSASFGGAINATAGDAATVEILECDIARNEAGFGGGIYTTTFGAEDPEQLSRVTIDRVRLHANVAHECCDTGIYVDGCFVDGALPDGDGRYYGGGADMRTVGGGATTMTNSLVSQNEGAAGGGIHTSTCGGGTIDVINCTVVDNHGSGALARLGLSSNQPENGRGAIRVANSIVRGNTGETLPVETYDTASTLSVRFSNLEGSFDGTANVDIPSRFADPDRCDYRLMAGAGEIDAGDNNSVPDGRVDALGGEPRFVDDPNSPDTGAGTAPIVDIGAHEFQASAPGRRRPVRRESTCPGDA